MVEVLEHRDRTASCGKQVDECVARVVIPRDHGELGQPCERRPRSNGKPRRVPVCTAARSAVTVSIVASGPKPDPCTHATRCRRPGCGSSTRRPLGPSLAASSRDQRSPCDRHDRPAPPRPGPARDRRRPPRIDERGHRAQSCSGSRSDRPPVTRWSATRGIEDHAAGVAQPVGVVGLQVAARDQPARRRRPTPGRRAGRSPVLRRPAAPMPPSPAPARRAGHHHRSSVRARASRQSGPDDRAASAAAAHRARRAPGRGGVARGRARGA